MENFNIVLFQPEIPFNTASIGRTCVLTGTRLHLIRPLGFDLSDKTLRRVGLDYWQDVDLQIHESYDEFLSTLPAASNLYFATTKAGNYYHQVAYQAGDYILFGRESEGLPEGLKGYEEKYKVKIPMDASYERSLNLSNACNIILFEALRQNNYFDLL